MQLGWKVAEKHFLFLKITQFLALLSFLGYAKFLIIKNLGPCLLFIIN